MKCQNCEIEIPPQWTVALKNNICPACGKEIMSAELQELIAGLSEAMEKMPNNPQGVACWIVSNYRLQKIADYAPIEGRAQAPNKPGNGGFVNQLPQQPTDALAGFFTRAGVDLSSIPDIVEKKNNKAGATTHQQAAAAIQTQAQAMQEAAATLPSPPPQIPPMGDDVVEEDGEGANAPLDEIDKMMLNGAVGSGYISEEEKEAIANAVINSKFGAENNPTIAMMMEKQRQMQENVANGVGAVSRSGKPAGFRRSG